MVEKENVKRPGGKRGMLLSAVALVLIANYPNKVAGIQLFQAGDAGIAAGNACAALPRATSKNFEKRLEAFLNGFCYQKQGWVHDPQVRTSDGVHPLVKVYYSPSMWTWMTAGRRQGDPPEGAMLVKEQYQTASQPPDEWTIMVKDPSGSHDGWYWADLSAPTATTSPSSAAISSDAIEVSGTAGSNKSECPDATFPSAGFGMYCLNCHASAANGTSTFATTSHVFGKTGLFGLSRNDLGAALGAPPEDNIHHRLAKKLGSAQNAAPNYCIVGESFDHVVAKSRFLSQQPFVTSDQCAGCHDATGTLSPTRADLPRMLWPDALASPMVNLSPNGEWRSSMMGLSGRDPIFFAQLNSENALHPKLQDHPSDAKLFVQDLCLHCHGVMGQRQYKQDTGKLFSRDELQKPNSSYGALARDGVSCAACHHISAEGLGAAETFTGNFRLGPADEIYGPFDTHVVTLPMKNALGVEAKATEENQIESSKLCGSCHTIILPVYNAAGQQVIRDGKPATFTEQATYLEWLNSSFTNQSCQDCHMPKDYKGNQLSYKIANIEDNTFPKVDFRAPDQDTTLTTRDEYHRHTLLGINVFGLEMFRQFRSELGLYETDPMLRDPAHTTKGIDTAIDSSVDIASKKTATVDILNVNKQSGVLVADVRVENQVGHSFPSGVGFRRAFMDFQVIDNTGQVVWESGGTTPEGEIVGENGSILETEMFSADQQRFQQHHWQKNPIKRQNEVQIYEELAANPEGQLTTSFISLDHKVKDNRLQPKGWTSSGPFAEETGPVGTCVKELGADVCDPDYQNASGSNFVRYEVPLNRWTAGAVAVRATLYYQSIPPYYLNQRATDASGTDTDRLIRFSRKLNVEGTYIDGWKLPIAAATRWLQ
jgi:hypothetical protein